MVNIPRLFRIEETAVALHESYGSVRDRIARGEIQAVRVGARGVRVTEQELERLLRSAQEPIVPKAPHSATGSAG